MGTEVVRGGDTLVGETLGVGLTIAEVVVVEGSSVVIVGKAEEVGSAERESSAKSMEVVEPPMSESGSGVAMGARGTSTPTGLRGGRGGGTA